MIKEAILKVVNGNDLNAKEAYGAMDEIMSGEASEVQMSAYLTALSMKGETIEETVHREVMEEVGLKVKNLRYYKSQPWSFSGTLLFGFFCDVDGDDTLTVDHEELSVAQWFDRDKIIGQDTDSSLTNEMMMVFAAGKEPK